MQDEASAGLLFGLDVIDWSLLVIAIALIGLFVMLA
jgi:hypothetical protein